MYLYFYLYTVMGKLTFIPFTFSSLQVGFLSLEVTTGIVNKGTNKIGNEPKFIKLCSLRANNACLGPVAPKMVVKDSSGHHQRILQ